MSGPLKDPKGGLTAEGRRKTKRRKRSDVASRGTVADMISRILDATVALADRLEESAASRVIGAYGDLIVAGVSAKDVAPSIAAGYALGCAGIAASLTHRLAARRLGRSSFSPLMAWTQGLDDDDLRTAQTQGDA